MAGACGALLQGCTSLIASFVCDCAQGPRVALDGDAVAVPREPMHRTNTARGGSPSPPRRTRPEQLRQQGTAAQPPHPVQVNRGSRRVPSESAARGHGATVSEAPLPRDARAVTEEAARARSRVSDSDQTRLAVGLLQPQATGSDASQVRKLRLCAFTYSDSSSKYMLCSRAAASPSRRFQRRGSRARGCQCTQCQCCAFDPPSWHSG